MVEAHRASFTARSASPARSEIGPASSGRYREGSFARPLADLSPGREPLEILRSIDIAEGVALRVEGAPFDVVDDPCREAFEDGSQAPLPVADLAGDDVARAPGP